MPFYRMPHKTPADDPHQPGQIINPPGYYDYFAAHRESDRDAHDWAEDFIGAQQKLVEFHNIFINRVTPGANQDFLTPLREAYRHVGDVLRAFNGSPR